MSDVVVLGPVLVVDDDDDRRAVVRVRLGLEGFGVVETARAVDAVAALTRTPAPAFVVAIDLDVAGQRVGVRELREAAPSARLVVVSSFADPYTLHAALEAGADACVDIADLGTLAGVLVSLVVPGPDQVSHVTELAEVRTELRGLGPAPTSVEAAARYAELVEREAELVADEWHGALA